MLLKISASQSPVLPTFGFKRLERLEHLERLEPAKPVERLEQSVAVERLKRAAVVSERLKGLNDLNWCVFRNERSG
jgi:hypothetical protein